MLKQQEILNTITQKLHLSAPSNYESAELIYKIIIDENKWTSFSATFIIQGKKVPPENFTKLQNELEPLLDKLHTIMKAESNSDWRKLVLQINEHKKVTVDFNYSEQNI